jgi:hypothetical protein
VGVIKSLEIIHVEHHEAEALAILEGGLGHLAQPKIEAFPVADTGQAVGHGIVLDFFEITAQFFNFTR